MNELETDAQKVLQMEAEAILDLIPRVDEHFDAAVNMILGCEGRVIMTGMGKSGIIAHKISATLASTGTPSFYLHPAEGIHGDLGMVTADDVIIAMSNSGETGEVLNILPSIRRIGARLIAMVGNTDSTLAKNADVVLNVGVKKEACPLGLAPTSSTTAALAFGDALAMALMGKHHFTSRQFAVFHPGGSLGRKLLLTVGDIMHGGSGNPVVKGTATVTEALFIITDKGLGAVSVVDENNIMIGLPGPVQRRGFPEAACHGADDKKSQIYYTGKTGGTGSAHYGKPQAQTYYGTACH